MPAINGILKNVILPWRHAFISLLFKKKKKKDKNPLDCLSFRPISLLNSDYKIVAKVLARRLETILPKIINPDQARFVKSRYGTDNVRCVLNVVHYRSTYKNPAIIVSLDAEKALTKWIGLFSFWYKKSLAWALTSLI